MRIEEEEEEEDRKKKTWGRNKERKGGGISARRCLWIKFNIRLIINTDRNESFPDFWSTSGHAKPVPIIIQSRASIVSRDIDDLEMWCAQSSARNE